MQINLSIINNLSNKPCIERLESAFLHYKDFDGNLSEFIALDKITYHDKVWVIKNLLSKPQLVRWGVLCAESVLYIFEDKYPDDKRPRIALKATRNGTLTQEIKAAAYAAAAYAAADAAAYADAYADAAAYAAAASAAADTDADADAADAAYAAAYAAADTDADAADAAYAARAAARAASGGRIKQQDKNLQFAIQAVSEVPK